jgi:hypothetical protein
MDGIQKNYSDNMYQKYKNNTIADGLSSIKNLKYEMNELLDISQFDCSYSPIDNSIKILTLQNAPKPTVQNKKKIFMKFL